MRVVPVAAAVVLLMCAFIGTLEAGDAEAEVKAVMDDYRTAMLTGEVASLLDLYSENWSDLHGSTKEDLKEGYKGTAEKGPAKGLEVDLSGIEVVIDGDVATVSPVTLSAPQGSITYTHTLQKEADGVWRFVRTVTLSWESFEMDAEERKLKAEHDAAAMAARDLRERLLSDPHRPGYHFVMPEGIATPFDPNGAIYWKGRYHLFYIFQDDRSGIKMDHWGHISSTDLYLLPPAGSGQRHGGGSRRRAE
jgi:ketosteroid isomerase-like protein